jgi:hypothetical protein
MMYSGINSINSPASGAGTVGEPRLMSRSRENARSRVRVDQCVSAVRAVECQCSSAYVAAAVM